MLQPSTILTTKGSILIESPAWYMRQSEQMEGSPSDELVDSLFTQESQATISLPTNKQTIVVTSVEFN
jgi:hypothetical protein